MRRMGKASLGKARMGMARMGKARVRAARLAARLGAAMAAAMAAMAAVAVGVMHVKAQALRQMGDLEQHLEQLVEKRRCQNRIGNVQCMYMYNVHKISTHVLCTCPMYAFCLQTT